MKKNTKKIINVIISIIYIIWGILSPLSALEAIIALNVPALASAAVGILMLLAGFFCILGIKKEKCRVFGVIIFICSIISVGLTVMGGFNLTGLIRSSIPAVLAWLFIFCLKVIFQVLFILITHRVSHQSVRHPRFVYATTGSAGGCVDKTSSAVFCTKRTTEL